MSDSPGIAELQQKLADAEHTISILKKIIDLYPGSVYWKDKKGRYLGRNKQAALKMMADQFENVYDIDSCVGKTDHDLFDKKLADKFVANDQHIMKNKTTELLEESATIPIGKKITQLSIKQPLYDDNNQVIGVIGSTIDITSQREAERLRQENILVKEKTQLLKLLAGAIAHEIKTPLTGIQITLDSIALILPKLYYAYKKAQLENLLADKEQISSTTFNKLEKFIDTMMEQIKLCNNIIDIQLGNVAKDSIETAHFEKLSMQTSIQSAINVYPYKPYEKHLVHVDTLVDFDYLGDKVLTQQIIWNLLKNALHSIHEAQKGSITIRLEQGPNWNHIYFADTGKGMSEKIVNQIFKDFYTSREEGTGIGLTFCKKVIEAYGGSIHCKSEVSKFTEFKLSFPDIRTCSKSLNEFKNKAN